MTMNTLPALWQRNARLHPDQPAVVEGNRSLSHAELFERGTRLAHALLDQGVVPGDRVAILAMNRLEYPEMLVANHLLGSLANTLNFRLAAAELEWIMRDSEPRVLLFESQYTQAVDSIRGALASIEVFVVLGEAMEVPTWCVPYETFLAAGRAEPLDFQPDPEDIAHLIYTSGTTGRPKGVMRSHRAEIYQAEGMACGMDVRPDSRLLEVMPLFHLGAQASALGVWWRAGAVHTQPVFDARKALRAVAESRITHLHLVPLMIHQLLDTLDERESDVSSLETLLYAAAPITPPVLRRGIARLGSIFVGMWGMTEGSGSLLPKASHRPNGTQDEVALLSSVGQEQHRARIRIVDEQGSDCPTGASGELWLSSDILFSGYWKQPEATREAVQGGWFRTGDMGYFDRHANIFLVDRKKDMIVTGGENVYSQEVERVLAEHPAVEHVAVIGVPDEEWGEAVTAIIILKAGYEAEPDSLIEHCRASIASYKKPKRFEFVDAFPVLASGKVNKVLLREKFGRPKC